MDMENSRGSFDRMGKLGLKKPRLHNELDFDPNQSARPFPQRQVASGVNTLASARFRANERDQGSNDSGCGPRQLLHQELVTQYKTALAELTFNSKPIITNLTIIADENVHAAKAIVATVCSNILEVPSEQKLPKLYLLDSIVKSIGREYIKYFAVRLPEVFCKAYRQVDSSVRSSMRHLFGTWKGVFPLQTLQMIEKEMGFTPAANASSSPSPLLKSDSQSQRTPHGIHVNPKYLERQRLQQSSMAMGTANDMAGTIACSTEDTIRLDRAMVNARPWADPRHNMRNIKPANRDAFVDSLPEKSISASYGGNEQGSTLSSKVNLGIGRTGGRVTDFELDKVWYKSGNDIVEAKSGQRNGSSLKHGISIYETTKSLNLETHQPPTQSLTEIPIRSGMVSRSWRNSEEEEFMWDNMDSRVTGNTASSVSSNLGKDHWTAADEGLDRQPSWQLQGQHLVGEMNRKPGHSKGFASTGGLPSIMKPSAIMLGDWPFLSNSTAGMVGRHELSAVQAENPLPEKSPSLQEIICQPHHEQTWAEQEHQQTLKKSHFSGDLQSKYIEDSLAALSSNIQVGKLQKSQQRYLHGPGPSLTCSQPRNCTGVLPKQQPGSSLPEVSDKMEKLAQSKVSLASETSDQSISSGLLAAVMKTGILNSSTMNNLLPTSFLDTRILPLQSGNEPTQLGSPQGKAASPSSVGTSLASSTVSGTSSQSSNSINASSPISSLLSSLVAKGLISAKSESSIKAPTDMLSGLEDQNHSISTGSSSPVAPVSGSPAVHAPSIGDEVDHDANSSASLSQLSATEIRNLIGFEFKPDVIRQFHPSVISELWDDLPHHCGLCGLRLRCEEQFNGHLVWHAMREKEQNGLIQASRRWYVQSCEWITGKVKYSTESKPTNSVDADCEKTDKTELDTMVPSDENQCLCMFCGELFEDIYCRERDEWMFKGATYLTNSDNDVEMASKDFITARGPIIHARCLSESSMISVPQMQV